MSGYESNIAESYFDFTRVSETGYQKYQHQMTQWPIKSCCEDVSIALKIYVKCIERRSDALDESGFRFSIIS